jgi:hypothetical protein
VTGRIYQHCGRLLVFLFGLFKRCSQLARRISCSLRTVYGCAQCYGMDSGRAASHHLSADYSRTPAQVVPKAPKTKTAVVSPLLLLMLVICFWTIWPLEPLHASIVVQFDSINTTPDGSGFIPGNCEIYESYDFEHLGNSSLQQNWRSTPGLLLRPFNGVGESDFQAAPGLGDNLNGRNFFIGKSIVGAEERCVALRRSARMPHLCWP